MSQALPEDQPAVGPEDAAEVAGAAAASAAEGVTTYVVNVNLNTMLTTAIFAALMAGSAAGLHRMDLRGLYAQVASPHGMLTSSLGMLCLALGVNYTPMKLHLATLLGPFLEHPFVHFGAGAAGLMAYGSSQLAARYYYEQNAQDNQALPAYQEVVEAAADAAAGAAADATGAAAGN